MLLSKEKSEEERKEKQEHEQEIDDKDERAIFIRVKISPTTQEQIHKDFEILGEIETISYNP